MLEDYKIARKQVNIFAIIRFVCYGLLCYSMLLAVPHFLQFGEEWHTQKEQPIMLRVIANSNMKNDQQLKNEIVENLQPVFAQIAMENPNSIEKELLFDEINDFINKNYSQYDIGVKIGDNLIPPKYDFNTFYPQNLYYSVILTVGSGRGDNWFCSAFPTVCEQPKEKEKQKKTFLIYEWIKKKMA
ncbi:stage II sporulation protein R [Solibacillus sp. CAU 1738]|uniref:stage II sporulation protein R n=1 Tax=Solibacillus sp. CAU 1738 TaxID=3140363 RepID=UPI0032613187